MTKTIENEIENDNDRYLKMTLRMTMLIKKDIIEMQIKIALKKNKIKICI